MVLTRLLPLLSGLALITLFGCDSGPKTVVAKGKLTKGGQPYKFERLASAGPLPPGEVGVRVLFKRLSGSGEDNYESYAILDASSMTFTVPGNDNKGVRPGEYEVIVTANTGEKTKAGAPAGGPPGGRTGMPMPPGGPGGPPGGSSAPPSMEGKEILRTKVTIPDAGKTDIDLQIK